MAYTQEQLAAYWEKNPDALKKAIEDNPDAWGFGGGTNKKKGIGKVGPQPKKGFVNTNEKGSNDLFAKAGKVAEQSVFKNSDGSWKVSDSNIYAPDTESTAAVWMQDFQNEHGRAPNSEETAEWFKTQIPTNADGSFKQWEIPTEVPPGTGEELLARQTSREQEALDWYTNSDFDSLSPDLQMKHIAAAFYNGDLTKAEANKQISAIHREEGGERKKVNEFGQVLRFDPLGTSDGLHNLGEIAKYKNEGAPKDSIQDKFIKALNSPGIQIIANAVAPGVGGAILKVASGGLGETFHADDWVQLAASASGAYGSEIAPATAEQVVKDIGRKAYEEYKTDEPDNKKKKEVPDFDNMSPKEVIDAINRVTGPDDVPTDEDNEKAIDEEFTDITENIDTILGNYDTEAPPWEWEPPEKKPPPEITEEEEGGGSKGSPSESTEATGGSTRGSKRSNRKAANEGVVAPEKGEQIDPNHAKRDEEPAWVHTNPDGTVVAGNDVGEVWEVEQGNPASEKKETSIVGGIIGIDLDDIIYGDTSSVEDNTSIVEETMEEVTGPQPNTGEAEGEDGGLVLGPGDPRGRGTGTTGDGDTGDSTDGDQGSGDNGTEGDQDGEGDGDGTGDGEGDGDGDGNGDGGSGPSDGVNSLFAGEREEHDLFGYTSVDPLHQTELDLIDYVAALKGR